MDARAGAAFLVLRLSALLWLALAVWQVVRVSELAKMGMLSADGARGEALVALLVLGAAWGLVFVSSLGPARRRLQAGVLAQGLSVGAIALTVALFTPQLVGVLRAGGPLYGNIDLMLASLAPQALALGAAFRGRRVLSPAVAPPSRAGVLTAWCVAAAMSFGLNASALGASSTCSFTEARAIADLRTLVSAEHVYRSVNAERFGPPPCLVTPVRCRAQYPPEGSAFLDPGLLRPVRCGYRFTFRPAPSVSPSTARATVPELESLDRFAISAVPIVPGVTGFRAFCADSDGVIWESPDGRLPVPDGPTCPDGMTPLP